MAIDPTKIKRQKPFDALIKQPCSCKMWMLEGAVALVFTVMLLTLTQANHCTQAWIYPKTQILVRARSIKKNP